MLLTGFAAVKLGKESIWAKTLAVPGIGGRLREKRNGE
jgi:hypothetical protein